MPLYLPISLSVVKHPCICVCLNACFVFWGTIIHVSTHLLFLSICLTVHIFVLSTIMGEGYTHRHTQMLNVDITHVSACACI